MRLEAAHVPVRAAQYTVPRSSVAQPAPRAMITREAPVCDNGERGGEHATIERERGAEVRCEEVPRYSGHRVVRDRLLQSRAYHVSTERALGAEERNHAYERNAQGTRESPTGGEGG